MIPVLFASQWFLTAFACPFPVSFACRVIDGLLAENGSEVLLRVGLAIMAECEADLLLRDDFEDLLTFLKVQGFCPCQEGWALKWLQDVSGGQPLVAHWRPLPPTQVRGTCDRTSPGPCCSDLPTSPPKRRRSR